MANKKLKYFWTKCFTPSKKKNGKYETKSLSKWPDFIEKKCQNVEIIHRNCS